MFCIKKSTIHEYTQRSVLSFLLFALVFSAVPHVGTAIAETGANIIKVEEAAFPVSADSEPRYVKWVTATSFSSDPLQTDDGPCEPAMSRFDLCKHFEEYGIEDTIATNDLPLGTHVKFPELYGDKVFVVRDRMNARYTGTGRIDFWVGSVTPDTPEIIAEAKAKARAFGVKRVKMEVYSK